MEEQNNTNTTYESFISKIIEVYDVFKEFFGEEFVDLQNVNKEVIERAIETNTVERVVNRLGYPYILVHFPEVTVTNEYDKSIVIYDLFAKVYIKYNGLSAGYFQLGRSTFTDVQYYCGYIHSHVPSRDFSRNTKLYFSDPCLGYGPIRNTIASLSNECDKDIWNLFCLELSKYVETESVAGVPYYRLEKVIYGKSNISRFIEDFSFEGIEQYKIFYNEFLKWYIENNDLVFNYNIKSFSIGMSFIDCMISFSNSFIKWYNTIYLKSENPVYTFRDLLCNKICILGNIQANIIVTDNSGVNITINNDMKLCDFKGKEFKLKIIPFNTENQTDKIVFVNINLVTDTLVKILNIINLKYGNTTNTTNQKIIFL